MSTKRITNYFPFRAFHNQKATYKTAFFFILPVVFNLIILYLMPYITGFWSAVYAFFLSNSGVYGIVLHTGYVLMDTIFLVPSLDMSADEPSILVYQLGLVVSIVLFLLTFLMSEKNTPMKYFFRVFIVILWGSLCFFYFFPGKFPYDIQVYTRTGILQIIAILFAIPWIFALTYYLFGNDYFKKILITCLTLLYFIILAPFQILLNAVIIHYYSLSLMPVLHLYLGLLINVFACVGFYSYGVSLEGIYSKWTTKPMSKP